MLVGDGGSPEPRRGAPPSKQPKGQPGWLSYPWKMRSGVGSPGFHHRDAMSVLGGVIVTRASRLLRRRMVTPSHLAGSTICLPRSAGYTAGGNSPATSE